MVELPLGIRNNKSISILNRELVLFIEFQDMPLRLKVS